jgi:hypothetical protein
MDNTDQKKARCAIIGWVSQQSEENGVELWETEQGRDRGEASWGFEGTHDLALSSHSASEQREMKPK